VQWPIAACSGGQAACAGAEEVAAGFCGGGVGCEAAGVQWPIAACSGAQTAVLDCTAGRFAAGFFAGAEFRGASFFADGFFAVGFFAIGFFAIGFFAGIGMVMPGICILLWSIWAAAGVANPIDAAEPSRARVEKRVIIKLLPPCER
jgi:hypothetical protein